MLKIDTGVLRFECGYRLARHQFVLRATYSNLDPLKSKWQDSRHQFSETARVYSENTALFALLRGVVRVKP